MKTIKFSNAKSGFSVELRKNVNAYFREKGISTKGNFKTGIKAFFMFAIFLVPFILMLTLTLPGWAIIPISITMGIGMAGLGMSVMHDAIHGSFSRHVWLNKIFGSTIYLIGGNWFNWKVQHNMMHHTFTNVEGYDEDINPKGVFRFSPHSPLKKIHRFQHLYAFMFYGLMTLSKLLRDFSQLNEYNKAGITRQQQSTPAREFTKMILAKIFYFSFTLGLPLIFSGYNFWLILGGFFLMHFTAGLIMSVVFQLAHVVEGTNLPQPDGEGKIENDWIIHELQTTSNFARNNPVINWFAGGLNFQIEHHLFPNISHIHYRHISHIVEKTAIEHGLVYNLKPTFRHAVFSHLRTLKNLGR